MGVPTVEGVSSDAMGQLSLELGRASEPVAPAKRGRIPFAFAIGPDGRVRPVPVEPNGARHREPFACPVCGRHVHRKGRPLVDGRAERLQSGRRAPRPYFAHRKDGDACPTGGEHWAHVIAKLLVHLAVHRWREGVTEAPKLAIRSGCGHAVEVALPDAVHEVIVDASSDGDVLLRDAGHTVVLGVDVLRFNQAPRDRDDEHWSVQIRAEDLLAYREPWPVHRTFAFRCPRC